MQPILYGLWIWALLSICQCHRSIYIATKVVLVLVTCNYSKSYTCTTSSCNYSNTTSSRKIQLELSRASTLRKSKEILSVTKYFIIFNRIKFSAI
jgi:hypothetical protein